MRYWSWLIACLLMTAVLAPGLWAQSIELKSAQLANLEGKERERFVAAHNTARKAVGVAPVEWSNELAKPAALALEQQKESLIQAAKERWSEGGVALPRHTPDAKYGENIAGWAGSTVRPAEFAVDLWLSEKAAFDKLNVDHSYRTGDEEGKSEIDPQGRERPIVVGHYTAVIWRATKQIGAAQLQFELTDGCTTRSYFAIICNYDPPGNRRGEKPD
jgi:cell wall-associated NlpC family hydrolase